MARYGERTESPDHTPLVIGGVVMVVLVLVELINRRPFLDILALILMALTVVVVAGIYLYRARRAGAERRETRRRARLLRAAQWRAALATWEGDDAVVLRKEAIVDDEVVLAEPERLFARIISPPESPAFDGEVAEVMGRAELRVGTMNARD